MEKYNKYYQNSILKRLEFINFIQNFLKIIMQYGILYY